MLSTQRAIYCINPNCVSPVNAVGDRICASCQTPLVYRYLWATGSSAAKIKAGIKIADRYEVFPSSAPQVWLDTQPGLPPDIPQELPSVVIPYLRLYGERLHIPQAYGFVVSPETGAEEILLLENVPINDQGYLYPSLIAAWEQAKAVRQVYWLWQILQLWTPLSELGVGQSLLIPDNLRVQGWCVRLLELHTTDTTQPSLQDLAHVWQPLVASAKNSIANQLNNIVQQMSHPEVELDAIATQLNVLLLSTAAEFPLNLQVVGATDTGQQLIHNEDSCFPDSLEDVNDSLIPHLAIVCDGIGGHQGGEVASQLAVQSLKLQIRALLAEVGQQAEIVPPDLLQEQLEVCLRVVNNMISSRNDEQKRQGRERMATTLVMAVQVPQRVMTLSGNQSENAHELYLVSIGDSRAYWMTRNYCQQLTVDDDVVTREVRLGRSLYHQALQRPDAPALTQALGSRDADALRITIKRLILEEDGILLLCSDGLSDRHWVEKSWQDYTLPILKGEMTLAAAVQQWIELANDKNGHDNISVVLTLCRTAKEYLVPIPPPPPLVAMPKLEPPAIELSDSTEVSLSPLEETSPALTANDLDTLADALAVIESPSDLAVSEPAALADDSPALAVIESPSDLTASEPSTFAESSQALLNLELTTTSHPHKTSQRQPLLVLCGLFALLVGSAGVSIFAWWQLSPHTLTQTCEKLPPQVQQFCPSRR